MSQWYQGGYFTPTLQICRLATSPEPFGVNDRFIRLGELTTLVNNYQDPFVAFDFIVIRALNAVPLVAPTLSEKQKVESRDLIPVADVHSDDFTYEEILGLEFEDGSYYHETQVWVPVDGRHITKVDRIPKISAYTAPLSTASSRSNKTTSSHEEKVPSHEEDSPEEQEVFSEEGRTVSNITNEEESIVKNPTKQEEESRGSEKEQNILDQIQPEIEEVDRKDVISTADEPKSKDTPQMTSEEQKRFAKAELMAQKLLEEQQRQEEEKKRREEQRKLKKEKN